jgi:hypothetical protein
MLMRIETMFFFVETLLEIGFHTLSLMNSTYPSTIWNKSSASYARMLAKYSMPGFMSPIPSVCMISTLVLVSLQVTMEIVQFWDG